MDEEFKEKFVFTIIVILILIIYINTSDIDHLEKLITDPDNLLTLVNKEYYLSDNYEPSDLEKINVMYANDEKYLRSEAKLAFEKLSHDAKKLGYKIIAISAYRDYNYQKKLYQQYIIDKGLEYANSCSAKPGHSEHQTGLAVDVMGSNNDYDLFELSKEFDWMKNNAHHYGFILRYPKNKIDITGFKYEPWHYRYVGKEVANIIYNNNLTLEEYKKQLIN